jgi:hypothetical protein
MCPPKWRVFYIIGISASVNSGTSLKLIDVLLVLNEKIQYLVKGHIVKPNECYKSRSEIVSKQ